MPTVYLAVGHGLKPDGTFDPGAVSEDKRWNEQKAGDIVVRQAAWRLRNAGIGVVDEAFKDDPNFVGSTKAANDLRVDLVVAVHHDWYKGIPATFGFWYPGSSKGEKATRLIVDSAARYGFDIRPDWVKPRDDLYILKRTSMPATLIECGVIGEADLDTPEELRRMGDAIAHGIANYFGVSMAAPQTDPEPDTEEDEVKKIIEDIQIALADAGFDPGPIDGIWGSRTAAAFKAMCSAAKVDRVGVSKTYVERNFVRKGKHTVEVEL